MIRTGITNIKKSESIQFVKTNTLVHFTDAIVRYAHETENLNGLSADKIVIKEINVQSAQPLKYKLWLWSNDTFDDTNLNIDSFKTSVLLDFSGTDDETVDRLNNANQYYLDIIGLNILYEDLDESNEIHCSLQNLSSIDKIAGAAGAVQLDVAYAPRL